MVGGPHGDCRIPHSLPTISTGMMVSAYQQLNLYASKLFQRPRHTIPHKDIRKLDEKAHQSRSIKGFQPERKNRYGNYTATACLVPRKQRDEELHVTY